MKLLFNLLLANIALSGYIDESDFVNQNDFVRRLKYIEEFGYFKGKFVKPFTKVQVDNIQELCNLLATNIGDSNATFPALEMAITLYDSMNSKQKPFISRILPNILQWASETHHPELQILETATSQKPSTQSQYTAEHARYILSNAFLMKMVDRRAINYPHVGSISLKSLFSSKREKTSIERTLALISYFDSASKLDKKTNPRC